MSMTLAAHDLLLSVHGIEIKFMTNSSALVESVEALLRHFECKTFEGRPMWRCDVYAEHRLLIADFYEEGVVVVEGTSGSVQGFLVRPEGMSPDIQVSFVHFAMTELL